MLVSLVAFDMMQVASDGCRYTWCEREVNDRAREACPPVWNPLVFKEVPGAISIRPKLAVDLEVPDARLF